VVVTNTCVKPPPPPPSQAGVKVQAAPKSGLEDVRPLFGDLRYLGEEKCLMITASSGFCVVNEDGQPRGAIDGSQLFGQASLHHGGPMQMASGLQAAPQTATERWYLLLFGPGGLATTEYLPDVEDFGMVLLNMINQIITDLIENDRENPTLLTLTNLSVRTVYFLTTDASGFPTMRPESIAFPAPGAPPITAIRLFLDGGVAVATTDGGLHYKADPSQPDAPQTVGTFFTDPRRLRAGGGLLFGSDFGGSKIVVFRWDGRSVPVFVRDVTVGDSPIGIDVRVRADGTIAVVGTGYNDNTYWVAIFSAEGELLSLTKTDLPEGCLNPGHATWLSDFVFVVTCNGSDQIVRVTLASE
jgi:hypothetical protein